VVGAGVPRRVSTAVVRREALTWHCRQSWASGPSSTTSRAGKARWKAAASAAAVVSSQSRQPLSHSALVAHRRCKMTTTWGTRGGAMRPCMHTQQKHTPRMNMKGYLAGVEARERRVARDGRLDQVTGVRGAL
jgi:hypothetical protein